MFFTEKYRNYWNDGTLILAYRNVAEYNVIENNVFNQGERAVHLDNYNGTYARGNIVRNNECLGQALRAIELRNQNAPIINDNYIYNGSGALYGILLENASNSYEIMNNSIRIYDPIDGIALVACNGGASLKGKVYNNFVSMWGSARDNVGMRITNCNYIQIYHNTVFHSSGWRTTSKTFYQTGGGNIDIRNNIFANMIGGYPYYINTTAAITTSDYNNYYSTGNYLAYYGGNKVDIAALAGTHDNNSISTHPVLFAGDDLHTSNFRLESKGDPLIVSLVPLDIDGDTRTGSPDLGADEFGTPTGAALSGTITIGPGQTNETIAEVLDSLNRYGIDGQLTLNLLDDLPFEEAITFMPVTGADASNRVTIQSDPGNDGDVIITYNTDASRQKVVSMWRASFITLKNLTIAATNATYPRVISFDGYCTNDSIVGCKISSIGEQSGLAAIFTESDYLSDIYIIGNEIVDARTSIWLEGASDRRFENIVIKDNLIESPFETGVYLYYCDAPVVSYNTINTGGSTSYYNAVYLYNCRFNYQVVGNIINNLAYDTGIYLRSSGGSLGKEGLVANNFIKMEGSAGKGATGIYTNGSDYVDVVFNTVRIGYSNDQAGANAFYNTGGSFINVLNNIFCNYGWGRAIYNNTAGAFDNCDYNCYYATNKYLARWGSSEKTTLEAWQTSSGKDAHSVFADPGLMYTANDLHTNSSFVDGAGTSFDTITVDIDGDLRDSPPDIGADEFTDPLTPLAGLYTIGGDSPKYITIDDAKNDLRLRGISAPVTFNIRTGDYPERLGSYYPISGANSKDTIVIQSESGNPEDVVIYTNSQDNLGYFRGVRYFTGW